MPRETNQEKRSHQNTIAQGLFRLLLVLIIREKAVKTKRPLPKRNNHPRKGLNPRMSDQSDQPNALTSDEVNYLGLILEIVESRNWQALVFAMTSHTRLFESFARSLARTDELNGMTM